MVFIVICLIVILSIAAYMDHRYGRIPNRLIVIGLILGLGMLIGIKANPFIKTQDAAGFFKALPLLTLQILWNKFFCMFLPFLFFYPFFTLGVLGAGDVKLFSMMGIYLSFYPLLVSIFWGFFAAAVIAVIKMVWKRSYDCGQKIHLAFPILLGVCIRLGGVYL